MADRVNPKYFIWSGQDLVLVRTICKLVNYDDVENHWQHYKKVNSLYNASQKLQVFFTKSITGLNCRDDCTLTKLSRQNMSWVHNVQ